MAAKRDKKHKNKISIWSEQSAPDKFGHSLQPVRPLFWISPWLLIFYRPADKFGRDRIGTVHSIPGIRGSGQRRRRYPAGHWLGHAAGIWLECRTFWDCRQCRSGHPCPGRWIYARRALAEGQLVARSDLIQRMVDWINFINPVNLENAIDRIYSIKQLSFSKTAFGKSGLWKECILSI